MAAEKAIFSKNVIIEEDTPGAKLPRENVEECTLPRLRRWLLCRGAKTSGKKADLVKRYNDYVKGGLHLKTLRDPDGGVHLARKKVLLGLIDEVDPPHVTDIFPKVSRDWSKCSKQATCLALTNFSQRHAFEMRPPQGKYPRDANVEVVGSEKVRKTTDPFALNTIPSLSLLQQWNSHLSFFEKEARGYYYLEHGSHHYSTANLQDMVKRHFARDVQNAVQAELNWFAQLYLKPVNMKIYLPDNAIK
ncbi:hypothetical protein AWC38_SpisGene20902 [Stylophora pistillata]|uniref:SAP domain-containing protein n=1 Tax=Stylophora pistillata TaxID=50429 RepID=A0A2B4RDL5_STYPI|nr:hypothetical protein AWC38_SpisGene20902 [Stylophora pistillata]